MSVTQTIRDAGSTNCSHYAAAAVRADATYLSKERSTEVLAKITDQENHLTDTSNLRSDKSRLSSQLTYSDALAGLRPQIALEN
ncbi:hypothetical protein M3A49_21825 [Paraburkholderia sp. CNPSo 3076]|uniref:hypothetical protein n=1 Tax=Paraburkholderia sp. CNPSo 3076 TaxID=2940936 RepID=UPI00225BA18C|nr:hypothetical protein [Paraburkholderia sp. CNPSo 3076]MCX5542113.1 hypothetical protein [Paraburkholderia sp. CNPSo 3076]